MVNNGASRACHACKQRHKKCDETRPSCLRCSRGRRECPGYDVSKDWKFVNYAGEADCNLVHHQSKTTSSTPLDMLHWPGIEQAARSAFFADYCIISSNQGISRGYLNGLQAMIAKAGPTSEVAQACTIIGLANLGKRDRGPMLLQKAESLHSVLLRSFRLSISSEAIFNTVESLITAALLGLYEIITCSDAYPGAHITHARGVSAILVSKFSPFDLLCGGKLFQVVSPLPAEDLEVERPESPHFQYPLANNDKVSQRFSVLCTPIFNQSDSTLDIVFAQTEPLIRKAQSLLAGDMTLDQLYRLKLEAEQLIEGYDSWPEGLSDEWEPRLVGKIALQGNESIPSIGYWPGIISSYHDPYIASVWNSYRKARLMVLNVILSCNHRIDPSPRDPEADASIHKNVEELIGGIVSSIPYLLAADLQIFLDGSTTSTPSLVPGRPVGGLLLMHTLCVLLTLPIVEPKLQVYISNCLAWIGDHMGIGQATILSKCTTMDLLEHVTEAHVLIWTGMLI